MFDWNNSRDFHLEIISKLQNESDNTGFEYTYKSDENYKTLKEAWSASVFAIGFSQFIQKCEIKMVKERFPDFKIRTEEETIQFELTKTVGKIKPNKEYKALDNFAKGNSNGITFNSGPFYNKEELYNYITDAIVIKINKRYDSSKDVGLLIDCCSFRNSIANMINYGDLIKDNESNISKFQSIWLFDCDGYLIEISNRYGFNEWTRIKSFENEYPLLLSKKERTDLLLESNTQINTEYNL